MCSLGIFIILYCFIHLVLSLTTIAKYPRMKDLAADLKHTRANWKKGIEYEGIFEWIELVL